MSIDHKPQVLASLTFLSGPLTDRVFSITKSITTIGRDRSNDIHIPDQNVSRFHASLLYNNDNTWNIENLSQTNTITVDQKEKEQSVLFHKNIVGLGEVTTFLFLLASAIDDQEKEHVQPSTPVLAEPMHLVLPNEGRAKAVVDDRQRQVVPSGKEEHSAPAQSVGTEVASFTAMGIPTLEVTDNTTGERKKYPLAQKTITIGKNPKSDIPINAESVSDLHLQIVHEGNQLILIHPHPARQQTKNGLLYQGQKTQGNESLRKTLTRGDTFRIDDEYGTLVTLTYNDGTGGSQKAPPKVQPITLRNAEMVIGRLQDNDVVLDHPQVSAHHARLVAEQGTHLLTDLSSTNHTYINGLQVTSQRLQPRDEIRIGPFRFIYTATELTQFDESEDIRIDALNLTKVGNNQTVLLNDISLSIPPRSFVALVGGSGAGKTTLLDALSGLRPAQQGSVFYNGQDYYRNLTAFSTQLGYVPQDDIIHRELTVERALYYAAKLRLPQDFTEAQITQRIGEVLDDVEMKHRRHLLIHQLSGGQRKRVSIALELLAKPNVFFLDEPTSGLDPGLDRKMMVLLRKLADRGHTILLVTHATNNINVCDYVCFLAPGGNLAYFGPPEEAKSYFKQPDFAEIYSLLEPVDAKRTIPVEAAEAFKQSPTYQKYVGDAVSQRPIASTPLLQGGQQRQEKVKRESNFWRQFLLLSQRYIELLKNDMGNLAILLLQAPIIGLLLLFFIQGVGTDGFNPNAVLLCPTTSAIIAAQGYPDVPTPDNPIVSKSCQHVKDFLTLDARGIAYAQQRGGVTKALQDFILPGIKYSPTLLFLMAFSAIMFGCINSIREIVKEVPIYRRERTVNLGILPYLFSKIAVLGLLCLVQSLILVICVNVFDPFRYSIFLPPFLEIYITIALTSLAGLMVGLVVSAIAPNNDRAMSFIPLLLLPQVIFAGTIFPLTSWYLQLPGMIFPIRWAMAALDSSAGIHSDKLNGDQLLGNTYTSHSTLFSIYSHAQALQYLLLMWLALVMMIVIFGIVCSYFLKRKDIRV